MGGLNQLYILSLLLKGFNALLECGLGTLLGIYRTADIAQSLHGWVGDAPVHGPFGRILASGFELIGHLPNGANTFLSIYLLAHGLVKLGLVLGLLRRQKWAFPVGLSVLGTMIVYQLYRSGYDHSTLLLVLTAFDIMVFLLIAREYRMMRNEGVAHPA